MEHKIKCWPEHYAAIDSGAKTCELRLNDRPYQRGDALLLQEWEPIENAYTGREMRVRVTHVLSGGPWLAPGYVALSIRPMGEDGRARVQDDFVAIANAERARADRARRTARLWKDTAKKFRRFARMGQRSALNARIAELAAELEAERAHARRIDEERVIAVRDLITALDEIRALRMQIRQMEQVTP